LECLPPPRSYRAQLREVMFRLLPGCSGRGSLRAFYLARVGDRGLHSLAQNIEGAGANIAAAEQRWHSAVAFQAPFVQSADSSSHLLGSQARFAAGSIQGLQLPKPKPRRDPDRPKRPTSAWLKFLADFRQQNQGLQSKEVLTKAAQSWRGMSATEKQPYNASAEQEKEAYKKKFDEYVSSGKRDAWAKPPGKPKAPPSAYLRFATQFRSSNPGMSMLESTKAAGKEWNSMSDAQKAPYQKEYEAAKSKYVTELESYKASGAEAAWKERVGIAVQEKKAEAFKLKAKAEAAKEKAKSARAAAAKHTAKVAKAKAKAKAASSRTASARPKSAAAKAKAKADAKAKVAATKAKAAADKAVAKAKAAVAKAKEAAAQARGPGGKSKAKAKA